MKTEDAKPRIKSPQEVRRLARERFMRSRRAESAFRRQLVGLGKNVGSLLKKYAPNGVVTNFKKLRAALNAYAEQIKPWAESVAAKMQAEVSQRDAQAWFQASSEMGQHLRAEITSAPTKAAMSELLQQHTELITSIPQEAAERVHRLTIKGLAAGQRPETVAQEILRTEHVTVSRAKLIARDAVQWTQSALTEIRAKHIGSEGYIWRTVMDSDVRPAISDPRFRILNTLAMGSHRKLEGTFHKWDDPPVASPEGVRAHPGRIYNCRCWAEPVLPDRI